MKFNLMIMITTLLTFCSLVTAAQLPAEGIYALAGGNRESCNNMFSVAHACNGFLILDKGALNFDRVSPTIFEQFCNLHQHVQKSSKNKDSVVSHNVSLTLQETKIINYNTLVDGTLQKSVNALIKYPGLRPIKSLDMARVKIDKSDLVLSYTFFDDGKWWGGQKCTYNLVSSEEAKAIAINSKHTTPEEADSYIEFFNKKKNMALDLISKGQFLE